MSDTIICIFYSWIFLQALLYDIVECSTNITIVCGFYFIQIVKNGGICNASEITRILVRNGEL